MKKKYILLSIALGFSLASCSDYLDAEKDLKHNITLEDVFSSIDYTEEWLANAYTYLAGSAADMGLNNEHPFAFSDDIYHANYWWLASKDYSENTCQESYRDCYLGIRQATIFIQNVDNNTLLSEEKRIDYKAQARFIRAFYYWKLLQKYGPIPLVPEEGQDFAKPYDELYLSRSTYDECVEFISSEMVKAAEDLPYKREAFNIARPTKGAALAIRARALLYAASPLMNGNKTTTLDVSDYAAQMVDDQGRCLLATNYSEEKWAKAAAAAKDVMDLAGLAGYSLYVAPVRNNREDRDDYPNTITPCQESDFAKYDWPKGYKNIDPFESYRSVFNGELTAANNPELVFTRGTNINYRNMVREQLPTERAKGNNKLCMTQKQCDAYYMADGTDCPGKDFEIGRGDGSTRLTGYTTVQEGLIRKTGVSQQYVGREPRFYASVAYSGVFWPLSHATKVEDRGLQSFFYRSSNNDNLPTGIGVMKFVRPTDTNDEAEAKHITGKADPAIRYAEVLLIYAEALNELDGDYNIPSWDGTKMHQLKRTTEALQEGIHPIRIRAGVPDYTAAEYNSKELLRAKLKRERQIELMGEGHRYFDLRRWLDAKAEESLPIYGCNTEMTVESRDLFHKPVVIASIPTCFADKSYFWPIHIDELYRNGRLTQNPGWQSLKN